MSLVQEIVRIRDILSVYVQAVSWQSALLFIHPRVECVHCLTSEIQLKVEPSLLNSSEIVDQTNHILSSEFFLMLSGWDYLASERRRNWCFLSITDSAIGLQNAGFWFMLAAHLQTQVTMCLLSLIHCKAFAHGWLICCWICFSYKWMWLLKC